MVPGSMLRTSAITQFAEPSDVNGLQRFMGMVNHLCKFVPRLADLSEPLRQLSRKDSSWVSEEPQQHSFQRIKEPLLSSEVLAHYDPNRPSIISADASSTGFGTVLTQVTIISQSVHQSGRIYLALKQYR